MTSPNPNTLVDHLFRHQYGKMVSILSKIFGPSHLDLIEDALQDTFIQAALKWRTAIPENPEGWLTKAARNRVIDLLRQINRQGQRHDSIVHGSSTLEIDDFFLDHEVADSQLRMIFLACHPVFSREEQIAFALKCISGFSFREIAAALLQKEETIKKRIARAKKKIQTHQMQLEYPSDREIEHRVSAVLQTIYLIFNEGFHSTKAESLVDQDLCGEALRLCKQLLSKERFRTGSSYALFALLCYHAARIEAKTLAGNLIDLEEQDRSRWYQPLIELGHQAFARAWEYEQQSIYLLEAAIAREHMITSHFSQTNWQHILSLYEKLHEQLPTDAVLLNIATVLIYMHALDRAQTTLTKIDPQSLNRRQYLYHATQSRIQERRKEYNLALEALDKAIATCSNTLEKEYLNRKRSTLLAKLG